MGKKENWGCEISPPNAFPKCEATVNGYKVPYFEFIQLKDKPGYFNIYLDGRFVMEDVAEEDIQRWMWMIADAMAISAGWSCHGEGAKRLNPHKVRVYCIDTDPPKLKIVPPQTTGEKDG